MPALPVYPIALGERTLIGDKTAVRGRLVNLDPNPTIAAGPARPVYFITAAALAAGFNLIDGYVVDIPMYEVAAGSRLIEGGPALPVYISNPAASPSGRA